MYAHGCFNVLTSTRTHGNETETETDSDSDSDSDLKHCGGCKLCPIAASQLRAAQQTLSSPHREVEASRPGPRLIRRQHIFHCCQSSLPLHASISVEGPTRERVSTCQAAIAWAVAANHVLNARTLQRIGADHAHARKRPRKFSSGRVAGTHKGFECSKVNPDSVRSRRLITS